MNKTELLIIGQGKTGLETVKDLLNTPGEWRVITATGDEEAIEKFHRQEFEVVVFTDDISIADERKLRKIFSFHNPEIIMVKHQHGDEGVLVAAIVSALDKLHRAKRPSYSLVDDALKNAGLDIAIE